MKRQILTALSIILLLNSTSLIAREIITATVGLNKSELQAGKIITIPMSIDITKSSKRLGSFTAELTWDINIFEFQDYKTTGTFNNMVFNNSAIASGKLKFAAAEPRGLDGVADILTIKFKVKDGLTEKEPLSLRFDAMAAAETFEDLLPQLKSTIDSNENDDLVPESYGLGQNYPNPFNPSTQINYQLPETAHVEISVFNMLGQLVRNLFYGEQTAGNHVALWNGRDKAGQQVSSGTYLLRMTSGDFIEQRKMLFLK